jgi:glycosyltransferase involved in cell wall biosynthesis
VPATAEPWLEHYKGFREYLESAYRTVVHQEDTCLIFDLGESRTDRPNRNPPLVTVVIPCYNQARFLGEAIESTLSQNYPNFEVVVVDDGSTDDTSEVAARYEKMLRFVRQVNQGRSEARNRGMAEGEGEYVVFLDADDRLLPDALEVGVRELEAYPECAFVSGHCTLIAHEGSPINAPPQLCVEEDHYLTLLQGNYIWNPASVMYRREVFDPVGGFAAVAEPCEDYDLYLRIARRYPVRCHEQAVVEYRQHDTNTSRDHELMLRSVLAVLDSQRHYVDGNERYERAYNRGVSYYDDYYGGLSRHQRVVERVRETVREKLPPDARVIVVNEGDEQLLELDGRWGWHFPQQEGGEPEKLFAQGAQGSEEAPWIRTGLAYEFRLYAGKEGEGGTLLAAVEVRRGGRQIPSPSSGAAGAAARSGEAFIAAEPNPVPPGPGLGKTTITWSTGDGGLRGRVYVCVRGDYASHYPSGSEEAIAHLESLRAKGGEYVVFPATSLWWLEHYEGFGEHLRANYRLVYDREDTCLIFSLREPDDNGRQGTR